MKHEWIIKFLKLYIKDPNIIGLVKKYLKVGVLDNGELMVNEEGFSSRQYHKSNPSKHIYAQCIDTMV